MDVESGVDDEGLLMTALMLLLNCCDCWDVVAAAPAVEQQQLLTVGAACYCCYRWKRCRCEL